MENNQERQCQNVECIAPAIYFVVMLARKVENGEPSVSQPLAYVCEKHQVVGWDDIITDKQWKEICTVFVKAGQGLPVRKYSNLELRTIKKESEPLIMIVADRQTESAMIAKLVGKFPEIKIITVDEADKIGMGKLTEKYGERNIEIHKSALNLIPTMVKHLPDKRPLSRQEKRARERRGGKKRWRGNGRLKRSFK